MRLKCPLPPLRLYTSPHLTVRAFVRTCRYRGRVATYDARRGRHLIGTSAAQCSAVQCSCPLLLAFTLSPIGEHLPHDGAGVGDSFTVPRLCGTPSCRRFVPYGAAAAEYDDGDQQLLDLRVEQVQLLGGGGAAAGVSARPGAGVGAVPTPPSPLATESSGAAERARVAGEEMVGALVGALRGTPGICEGDVAAFLGRWVGGRPGWLARGGVWRV